MDNPLLKYLLLWIVGVHFLFFSCKNDDKIEPGAGNGEGEVEMYFAAPQTYSTTASLAEQAIMELDILVFKNNKFRYRRQASKSTSTNSFRSTLRVDDNIDIYLFANCRTLLENCATLKKTDNDNPDLDGEEWETVRKELLLTGGAGLDITKGSPMWGFLENKSIVDYEINQLGLVEMLRSVVSVDVICEAMTFTLTEAYLFFVPDKGLIAPKKENLGRDAENNLIVTKAESPGDMKTILPTLKADQVQENKILYQLYSYENPVSKGETGVDRRFTRLVVGGKLGNGPVTYYPVDFLDDQSKYGENDEIPVVPILRNTKYQIVIEEVTSEGFPDENIASEEFDARMKYSVVPWQEDSQEVIFDGPYYVSLESRYANLARTKGFRVQLDFTTNIPEEDLTMTLENISDYGTNTNITDGLENDRFRVEYVRDADNKLSGILFTTQDVYDKDDPHDNQQVLTIEDTRRKRIKVNVYIKQLDRSPADWVDGGGVPSEIGEENN